MLSPTLRDGLKTYAIGPRLRALRLKKKMGPVELGAAQRTLSPAMLSNSFSSRTHFIDEISIGENDLQRAAPAGPKREYLNRVDNMAVARKRKARSTEARRPIKGSGGGG